MRITPSFYGHKKEAPLRYPGCSIYLDPFVGSGGGLGVALEQGISTAWIAESDDSLLPIWEAIVADDLDDLIEFVNVSALQVDLSSNEQCTASLARLWSRGHYERVAARVVLSMIGFNGLTRTNLGELQCTAYPWPTAKAIASNPKATGRLGGRTVQQKQQQLFSRLRLVYAEWRAIAERLSAIDVQLFSSAASLCSSLDNLPVGRVGSLIDPPYFSQEKVTPCYPGHEPNSPTTFRLCEDAVRAIVPISEVCWVTNYRSPQFSSLMEDFGFELGGEKVLSKGSTHGKTSGKSKEQTFSLMAKVTA